MIVTAILASLIKLLCGVAVFVMIGYAAHSPNPRLAGVLLTFPVLNGIGLLTATGNDPIVMSDVMYPMMVINAVLFLLSIAVFARTRIETWAPRRPHVFKTMVLACYGALWVVGAVFVAPFLIGQVPPGVVFFAVYLVLIIGPVWIMWRTSASTTDSPPGRQGLWTYMDQRRGTIAIFALTLGLLLSAPAWSGSEWVGKLSALPLPGAFALAGIAIERPRALRRIRQSVLLGPVIAMIFTWSYAHLILQLRTESAAVYWSVGIVALLGGWTVAMLIILAGLPRLETALDALKARSGRSANSAP